MPYIDRRSEGPSYRTKYYKKRKPSKYRSSKRRDKYEAKYKRSKDKRRDPNKVRRKNRVPKSKIPAKGISVKKSIIETEREKMKHAEFVAKNADVGAMMPTTQIKTPDLASVMEFINEEVKRYAMTTSVFCFPAPVPPCFYAFYLQMAFLAWINKVGDLTGTKAALVPNDIDEWAIPLPFAVFLQGFAPYREDGASIRTAYDHSTELSVTNTWWGYGDFSSKLAPDAEITWYPFESVIMLMDPNIGQEYQPHRTSLPAVILESQFAKEIFQTVCDSISAQGLAFCWGKTIPTYAYDGSAYAYINKDVSDDSSHHHCYWFTCEMDKFEAESALIYNKHKEVSNVAGPQARVFSKKCICCGFDEDNQAMPWFLQPMATAIFVLSVQDEYPKRGLSYLRYCKVPLETLFPVPVMLSYNGFSNLVNEHYQQMYSQRDQSLDMVTPFDNDLNYWWMYYTVMSMTFLARFLRQIPYFRPYFVNQGISGGIYTTQGYYASPGWLNTKLPPLICDAILSVGVVVYRGRLYYPDFPVRLQSTTGANSFVAGSIWSFVNGFLPDPVIGGLFNLNIIAMLNTNQPPTYKTYQILIGSQSIGGSTLELNINTNTVKPLFGISVPGYWPVFTCNMHADKLQADYLTFNNFLSNNSTVNGNLVHLHYEKCGATYMMLMSVSGTSGSSSLVAQITRPWFRSATAGAVSLTGGVPTQNDLFSLCVPVLNGTTLASLVQCNSDDVTLAFAYYMNLKVQTNLTYKLEVDAKFAFQLPSELGVEPMILNLIQEMFSPGNAFAASLAAREAKYRDNLGKGPMMAVVRPNMDHCFVGELFRTGVRAVSSGLRLGVGALAGGACSMAADAVGAEFLSGIAKNACSSGATRVYDFVASNLGIDSNNTENTKAQAEVEAVKTPVDSSTRGYHTLKAVKSLATQVKASLAMIKHTNA